MNQEMRDEKIEREIQLELRCVPLIEHGSVGVEVKDGVVTLTGYVADPSARHAAEQLARRTRGVYSVASEIEVRRPSNVDQHGVGLVRAVVDAFGKGHKSQD